MGLACIGWDCFKFSKRMSPLVCFFSTTLLWKRIVGPDSLLGNMWAWTATVAAGLGTYWALGRVGLCTVERTALFQPERSPSSHHHLRDPRVHVFEMDGIAVRYYPAASTRNHDHTTTGKTKTEATTLVLYCHGNAEGAEGAHQRGIVHWYHAQGYDVALWDYPGYGTSRGSPTCTTTEQAVVRVHDALVHRYRPATVVCHGFSLGGAFATHLATRRRLDGLVLESTFRSISTVPTVTRYLLGADLLDTERRLGALHPENAGRLPVLLMHGTADSVIPCAHSRHLHGAAQRHALPARLLLGPGAGHCNLLECDAIRHSFWNTWSAAGLPRASHHSH